MEYSEYYQNLAEPLKTRYRDRVLKIGFDPFRRTDDNGDVDRRDLPKLSLLDLAAYFIYKHSVFTTEQLNCHHSMEAYRSFKAGFLLKKAAFKTQNDDIVLIGQVKHSQRWNAPPHSTWAHLKNNAEIITAHCTCLAGLGESCKHAAILLFYLLKEEGVTEGLCKWNVPSVSDPPILPVKDIMWPTHRKNTAANVATPVTDEKLHEFLASLEDVQPAIYRVMEPYCNPASTTIMPQSMAELFPYDPDNGTLSVYELRVKSNPLMPITAEEAGLIAEIKQGSHTWHKYRAGRITGSKFHAACRTKIEAPAVSTVRDICYPGDPKKLSKIPQLEYGKKKEPIAWNSYKNIVSERHIGPKLSKTGLVISSTWPQIAASPDGLIECDCCGKGVFEIKCPYSMSDDEKSLKDFCSLSSSCLESDNSGFKLKKNHDYYYQVQLQMYVTTRTYCDFFVWSKKEFHLERIERDDDFLKEMLNKALIFHSMVIIPELLGRVYTREENRPTAPCVCKREIYGEKMVRCSSSNCPIGWYHVTCSGTDENTHHTKWTCLNCSL